MHTHVAIYVVVHLLVTSYTINDQKLVTLKFGKSASLAKENLANSSRITSS